MDALFRNTVLFLARFAGFVGIALAFGMPLVDRLVARPALATEPDPSERAGERVAERFGSLLALAAFTTLAAAVVFILMQWIVNAEFIGGLGWESLSAVVRAPYGRWYIVRIAAAVGLIVVLARGLRRPRDKASGEERLRTTWMVLAVVGLATFSLSGHASVGRPLVVSIPNDIVHLAAGSLWFSGIVFLRAVLPALWHDDDEAGRLRILTPVVRRFSHVALVCMAIVAATGTVNSFLHIAEFGDLTTSTYGLALVTKLVLFGAILALGGLNHFFIRRRLERALATGGGDSSRHIIRYTLGVEIVVALALFVATAVLADLPRTREL